MFIFCIPKINIYIYVVVKWERHNKLSQHYLYIKRYSSLQGQDYYNVHGIPNITIPGDPFNVKQNHYFKT